MRLQGEKSNSKAGSEGLQAREQPVAANLVRFRAKRTLVRVRKTPVRVRKKGQKKPGYRFAGICRLVLQFVRAHKKAPENPEPLVLLLCRSNRTTSASSRSR